MIINNKKSCFQIYFYQCLSVTLIKVYWCLLVSITNNFRNLAIYCKYFPVILSFEIIFLIKMLNYKKCSKL